MRDGLKSVVIFLVVVGLISALLVMVLHSCNTEAVIQRISKPGSSAQ